MILRAYFVLLLIFTADFIVDGLHVKIKKSPNNLSAVKVIQDGADKNRLSRQIMQWLLRDKKKHKKAVVLDRKDHRVEALIKQLIGAIENAKETPVHHMKLKHYCQKNFGSIYDAKGKKLMCLRHLKERKQNPVINFLIPVDGFIDSTRLRHYKGYPDDFSRRFHDDFDDNNVYHAKDDRSELKNVINGRLPRRYEVIKNKLRKPSGVNPYKKPLTKAKNMYKKIQPIESQRDSDSSHVSTGHKHVQDKELSEQEESKSSDTDDEQRIVKDEQIQYKDIDSDSDGNRWHVKDDNKFEKEIQRESDSGSELLSDEKDAYVSAVTESRYKNRKIKTKNQEKREKNRHAAPSSKYAYIQGGSKLVTTDSESEESYRRADDNFLPKRYHWDSTERQRLKFFWFNG